MVDLRSIVIAVYDIHCTAVFHQKWSCVFLLLSGCDRQKYHERRDKLEETHKTKVQSLIDNWRMSEKRYKLLKSTDEDQAAGSISCKLCRFGCFACLKIIQLELGWKTLFKTAPVYMNIHFYYCWYLEHAKKERGTLCLSGKLHRPISHGTKCSELTDLCITRNFEFQIQIISFSGPWDLQQDGELLWRSG